MEFAAVVLVASLVATAVAGHLLVPGVTPFSSRSDFLLQHLSLKGVQQRALEQGDPLPTWRDDQFSGMSVAFNPQAQFLFPLHAPFWFLSPAQAHGPTLWLLFVANGVGLYLLGWALALRRAARATMAVAGVASVKLLLAAHVGWLPVITTAVTLPYVVAAVVALLHRPDRVRIAAAAAALALALQSGGHQLLYYTLLALLPLVLWPSLADEQGSRTSLGSRVGALAVAGALALGLAAPWVLGLTSEAPLLSRSAWTYPDLVADGAFSLRHLLLLLHPEALGDVDHFGPEGLWEVEPYLGFVPLWLALAGLWLRRHRSQVQALAVATLLTVVLAMDTPLLRALHAAAPGFDLFRVPARFLFVTAPLAMALAGHGVDAAMAVLARRRGAAVGGLVLLCALHGLEARHYARRYLPTRPTTEIVARPPWVEVVARDPEPRRLAVIGPDSFNFGLSSEFGLQLVNGYDPFNLAHYRDYLRLVQPAAPVPQRARAFAVLRGVERGDLLDVLNVGFVLAPAELAVDSPALELVGVYPGQPTLIFGLGERERNLQLYRNRAARPRAFLIDEVVAAASAEEAATTLAALDAHDAAVVEGGARASTSADLPTPTDQVAVEVVAPGVLRLSTTTAHARYLVISEVWHPGWNALLDDRPWPVYRTDVALMGTWVPPGDHVLRLEFSVPQWRPGLTLFAAALIVTLRLAWRRPPPGRQVRPRSGS